MGRVIPAGCIYILNPAASSQSSIWKSRLPWAVGRRTGTWKNTRWCHGFSYFFMPLTLGVQASLCSVGCAHPPSSQGSQGNSAWLQKKGFYLLNNEIEPLITHTD